MRTGTTGNSMLRGSLLALLVASSAFAQEAAKDFPARPVRLIVPYAPGGATDITARQLQPKLSELWGQPIIVDNRPGASGNIALELAAKAAPDGYTLLVGNVSTNAINETIFGSLKVKPSRDLSGVTNLIQLPHLWVVNPSVPASTLKEFVAYASKSGGRLNYGSAGVGSYPHLDAVKFLKIAGLEMTHVPYKGGAAQMIPAIMGNEVQFMFINMASSLSHIRAGRIKPLAITTAERHRELPNVPTTAESGFPGVGTNAWNGLFAPAGASRPLLERIHAGVVKIMQSAEMRAALDKVFMTVVVDPSPEAFQRFVLKEVKEWAKIIVENQIKVE
ncbi:MAG TPA: tripartite tricarboxylate transporter substrate binding protein [Burkholderiales bacterium]|nr:tripartite tricarboxylate transporter substrate binding protein [Burkholderiales bacterium]